MFFQKPEPLPDELIFLILDRLPLTDALTMLRVSSQMNRLIKDDSIWKKYGTNNFEEFAKEYKLLNWQAQMSIKEYSCTIGCAKKYCSPDTEGRMLLLAEEIGQLPEVNLYASEARSEYNGLLGHLNMPVALIAWSEKLITWDQLVRLGNLEPKQGFPVLWTLFKAEFMSEQSRNTLRLLRENKFFIEEVIRTEIHPEILEHLLHDNGIKAMHNGLTLEDASKAKSPDEIKKMIETKISEFEPTNSLPSGNPLKK